MRHRYPAYTLRAYPVRWPLTGKFAAILVCPLMAEYGRTCADEDQNSVTRSPVAGFLLQPADRFQKCDSARTTHFGRSIFGEVTLRSSKKDGRAARAMDGPFCSAFALTRRRPDWHHPADSAARHEECRVCRDDPEVLGPHQGRTTFNFNWGDQSRLGRHRHCCRVCGGSPAHRRTSFRRCRASPSRTSCPRPAVRSQPRCHLPGEHRLASPHHRDRHHGAGQPADRSRPLRAAARHEKQ